MSQAKQQGIFLIEEITNPPITELSLKDQFTQTLNQQEKKLKLSDTDKEDLIEVFQEFTQQHPEITRASGGNFLNFFLKTLDVLDTDVFTPLRNAQVFSEKFHTANFTPTDTVANTLTAAATGSSAGFITGVTGVSIIVAAISFAYEWEKQQAQAARGIWQKVHENFKVYSEFLFNHLKVNNAKTAENNKTNTQEEEKNKQFARFVWTYVQLFHANQKLYGDTFSIQADLNTLTFKCVTNQKESVSSSSETFLNIQSSSSENFDDDEIQPLLSHSSSESEREKKFSLNEKFEKSVFYKVAGVILNAFLAYAVGYWISGFALKLITISNVFAPVPFLPTIISLTLPLLFVGVYLALELRKKLIPQQQKEEERALANLLDYIHLEEMLEQAKQQHFANAMPMLNDATMDGVDVVKSLNNSDDHNTLTEQQKEKIAKRKQEVEDFLSVPTNAAEDAVARRQEYLRRQTALSVLSGVVLSLLLAWVALDLFEDVVKANVFGFDSAQFLTPPTDFNAFASTEAIVLVSLLLATVVLSAICAGIRGYHNAKKSYAELEESNSETLEHVADHGIDLDRFAEKAEKIATQEAMLENLRAQIEVFKKKHAQQATPEVMQHMETLRQKAQAVPLMKFDGRRGKFLSLIDYHSDRHFRRQDDYGKFAEAKTIVKKSLRRGNSVVAGLGTSSLVARMLAILVSIAIGSANTLSASSSLLILIIPVVLIGLCLAGLKLYHEHVTSGQERQNLFMQQIELRDAYADQELNFLTTQVQSVQKEFAQLKNLMFESVAGTEKNSTFSQDESSGYSTTATVLSDLESRQPLLPAVASEDDDYNVTSYDSLLHVGSIQSTEKTDAITQHKGLHSNTF